MFLPAAFSLACLYIYDYVYRWTLLALCLLAHLHMHTRQVLLGQTYIEAVTDSECRGLAEIDI